MTAFYIVLAVAAALVLLTVGLSFLMFYFMFSRPKRSTKVPKFYMDSPHYKVSRAGMKIMDTLPVEDAYITSRDGLKLHAYVYPAEEGKKKFILGIHGYRSYARPEYGPYIEFYRSLGYTMILPDDRAHAPSEGKYIGFGVLDRFDCVDWAKYIVKTYGEDVEIRLHGVSMGGATVAAASGEQDLPEQVKGIVCDCGFSEAWEVIAFTMKNMMHMPVKPFLPIIEFFCKKLAGFDFHTDSAKQLVKKAKVPIMFVQGGKDPMVPPYMAQDLYDACASRKMLMMVPEAAHAESIAYRPEEYHKNIREFFGI